MVSVRGSVSCCKRTPTRTVTPVPGEATLKLVLKNSFAWMGQTQHSETVQEEGLLGASLVTKGELFLQPHSFMMSVSKDIIISLNTCKLFG